MGKTIVMAVGMDLPVEGVRHVNHRSRASLTDADVILFNTSSFNRDYRLAPHQNKAATHDEAEMIADARHWNEQLKDALRVGKNVIAFLSWYDAVELSDGKVLTNYWPLPVKIEMTVQAHGMETKASNEAEVIKPYWDEFGSVSRYSFYINAQGGRTLLTTKTGGHIVGAMYAKDDLGCLVLLPPILHDAAEKYFSAKDGKEYKSLGTAAKLPDAKKSQFWLRYFQCIIEVDRNLRARRASTPPPAWAMLDEYRTSAEQLLTTQLSDLQRQIQEAVQLRTELRTKLAAEASLRALLYEKGKALELSIVAALRLLGFTAEQVQEGESEFDVIFSAVEGRFIGEAEGKDNSAINVDKFRQLESNIQEDFNREGTSEHAKGVLFGNASRLLPISERGEFFTAKCLSSAKRLAMALVRTPDLFLVARYLRDNTDLPFAELCRRAIFDANGVIVQFPSVPVS